MPKSKLLKISNASGPGQTKGPPPSPVHKKMYIKINVTDKDDLGGKKIYLPVQVSIPYFPIAQLKDSSS